jgi:hypothetical protein
MPISYHFGTGDGETTTWTDPADRDLDSDGVADAIALDFDGDGRVDDAMWDSDGDGVADTALLDLDDDGAADHGYTDPTGLGTWNARDAPLPGPAPAEPAPLDWTDRSGQRRSTPDDGTGTGWVDFDGDGEAGELARDLDRDGIAEQVLVDRDGDGRHETAYLDVDGDGGFDLQLVDADADGRAEETYREGEPGFDL